MTNDSGPMDINDKIKDTTYLTWRIILDLATYSHSISGANVPKKRPISSRALKSNIQKLCSLWDVTLQYSEDSMNNVPHVSAIRNIRDDMVDAMEYYAKNPDCGHWLCCRMQAKVDTFAHHCCARFGYMDALYTILRANPSQSEKPTSHSASSSTQE